jgi:hypothetical protein
LICKLCGKLLSEYNKTKKCYSHSEQNEIDSEEVVKFKPIGLKKGLGRLRRRKLARPVLSILSV